MSKDILKRMLIVILVISITSCKTYNRTIKPRKKTTKRTVVKDETPVKVIVKADTISTVKPITQTAVVTSNPVVTEAIIVNKTIFDPNILDVIYANKPYLSIKKVDYIKKYSTIAIHEMETYNIPASITLAQGLLESRYGQSTLTKNSKNHFGIKCHTWTGDRVYHDDDKKGECFRKYNEHESSFRDHSLFLSKKRYAKLFTFSKNDYKAWAKELQKAGYATDKKYPEKLIELIEEYQLYYFDNLVLDQNYQPKQIEQTDHKEMVSALENKKPVVTVPINQDFYFVKTGDTLYNIAKITNVSVTNLVAFNNINNNEIAVGQKLFLKNNLGSNTVTDLIKTPLKTQIKHIVKTGDTIYAIARLYETTVANLVALNNLTSNNIEIGQEIIIK